MRKLNKKLIEELSEGKCVLDNTGNPDKELLQEVIIAAFPKDSQKHRTAERYSIYTYFGKYRYVDLTFVLTDEKNSHALSGWNKIIPLKDFEIKELTELPQKWTVKSKTLEQDTILTDWFNEKYNKSYFPSNFSVPDYYYYSDLDSFNRGDKYEEYTEISFEDFQRLVLNKDMRKYTIEEIKRDRISVRCSSKEEGLKLCKNLNPYYTEHDFKGKSNFEICFLEDGVNWQDYYSNIYPGYFVKEWNSPKLINFNEVDFEEKPKFTKDDWINGKCAIEWEKDKKDKIQSFIHQCCPDYMPPVGVCKYYWGNGNRSYSCGDVTGLPIVKIDELIMEKRKIIGYKAPYDLFKGAIKKGHIYRPTEGNCYSSNTDKSYDPHLIPKEIVETWEPVYEEEKKLPKINGYEGKVEGDYIIYGSSCAKFHKQFFKDLECWLTSTYVGQNRTIQFIKLNSGVEITKEQIEQIVQYLNSVK